LKSLFFNANGKLRNGWWVLIFIAFVAVTSFIYKPLSHGLKSSGLAKQWFEPLPFLMALFATWACTRLRKEPLSSVGFRLGRRWFQEAAWGLLLGVAMMLFVVAIIWLIGGVRFELDPSRSAKAMLAGLYFFLFAALLEETLFRGFLFQRLIDGLGVWPAQIVLATLFALAHWGSPGMQGTTEIVASADIFLAAVMLGLAYIRTRSLALPLGLHLGWNYAQGHMFGFGVSGFEFGGWLKPVFQGKAEWLTGGAFGPESSVFSPPITLLVIVLLWRWKGSRDPSADAPAAATPRSPVHP
jgi:uncharacterized protein